MKSLAMSLLAGTASVLLLAAPVLATTKSTAAPAKTTAVKSAVRSAWPPETLSGKIISVDPGQNLVVVQGPDGVPFDMVATARTRIRSGNEPVTLQDLSGYQNQNVSVRFIPERRGDVAESIRINS